ncbi:MAG: NAD(P)/FAD-dependent oxidoreductase [Winogradskyella sp.]|uniref:NAD(P)/FAD-dependent oxidoreductase n=1 Tax=Winogradskyella sp. TaxID=1883156 RepID=UPI00178F613B|nr:NAD(P)/FAD-dependent oxidoreductase [Winogradskyella sp.]MBT8243654.1 NAD(P)/FAD-dependent oxidoreductase [Winogradskyella sp.]NNK22979.1 NAD(P)/FAD-dependent oxidoreductase [Winogradskyella sp.]
MSKTNFDVIIIGGGLAGLTSAIHLSKQNFSVLLIEKNSYPKHKVCGEYVSNEVLPYLAFLGFNPFEFGAKRISEFELTTHNNKKILAKLPLGGFGMSRYELDFQLYRLALKNCVEVLQDTVLDVVFKDDIFQVETKSNGNFQSKITIGAFGKRSSLDVTFNREFIQKKSPYLGVKIHVSGDFPEEKVALHNFKGGYCGVSKVENDHINLCYITNYEAFKKHKDIETFQRDVMFNNSELKIIFQNTKAEFDKPLTISQISFETKDPIENHMIMCGDTAGMIHPLCGNGMGMAIRSSQLASQLIIDYLEGKIETRQILEERYKKQWRNTFSLRLKAGHIIAYLFRQDWLAPKLLTVLRVFPFLVPKIIKMTHGKPMSP